MKELLIMILTKNLLPLLLVVLIKNDLLIVLTKQEVLEVLGLLTISSNAMKTYLVMKHGFTCRCHWIVQRWDTSMIDDITYIMCHNNSTQEQTPKNVQSILFDSIYKQFVTLASKQVLCGIHVSSIALILQNLDSKRWRL